MTRTHRHRFHLAPQDGQSTLSDLPGGSTGILRELLGGKDLTARLASLGLTPGVPILVIQNFNHGPLMIVVRDTRIALGRGEARKVLVDVT